MTQRPRDGPSSAGLPWACAPARGLGAVGPTPRQDTHARPSRLRTGPDYDTPATSCRTATSPRRGPTPAPAMRGETTVPPGSHAGHRAAATAPATPRGQPRGEHEGLACPADGLHHGQRPHLQRRISCRSGTPGTGHTRTPAGGRRVRPLGGSARRLACLARATCFPALRPHRPRRGVPRHGDPFRLAFRPRRVWRCEPSGALCTPRAPAGMGTGHRSWPAALDEAHDTI